MPKKVKAESVIGGKMDVMHTASFDVSLDNQSITEEKNGDLLFWAVAVDKNPEPNAKGLVFAWRRKEDVDIDRVKSNGVLLYGHDSYMLPIGRIEKILITRTQVRMLCRIPGGEEFEDLQWIRTWVKNGYVKAVSIGFYILESEDKSDKKGDYLLVRKFQIVELSIVTIGAHATALIEQKLDLMQDHAEEWGKKILALAGSTPAEAETGGAGEEPEKDEDDEPVEDAPAEIEPAGSARPWSTTEVRKTAGIAQLFQMAAYIDGPGSGKTSFKLLHHHPDGVVSRQGLKESLAIALGARGGIGGSVDGEAHIKAIAHLRKHYVEAGLEFPAEGSWIDSNGLRALAAKGLIAIPGSANVLQVGERLDILETRLASLEQSAMPDEQQKEASATTAGPGEPAAATITPSVPQADEPLTEAEEAGLAALVRLMEEDPTAKRERAELIDRAVAEIRRGNEVRAKQATQGGRNAGR